MKPKPAKRPRKADIKAAADRADKRSKGEPVVTETVAIDPKIIPAETLIAKSTRAKRKKGIRRTSYSQPLAKAICKMLSSGMTLQAVCRRPVMPFESAVRMWAIDPNHPFSSQYARAREVGYVRMADQIIEIADDSASDTTTKLGRDGAVIRGVDREVIERARLRIETRKWLMSKALPKVYGDKVALEHAGKDGGPIETRESSPQPTGEDHLSDLTKRYSGAKVQNPAKPASVAAEQKGKSGLH